MNIEECKLIDLPRINDPRGNLTYIEGLNHIPFDLKRIFYLYDVPGGATRAGHALKTCHQLVIASSGSFDVVVDDGERRARHQLNRSYCGLYIPPLIWREIDNFSSNSICLVIASECFAEDGYYRDYADYLAVVQTQTNENPVP